MKRVIHKRYKIKRKKSIFKKPIFWWLILFLILAGVVFYFLVFFDQFQVKKIIISGNEKIVAKDIENLAREGAAVPILFTSSQSIFLLNTNKIKDFILDKFPAIGYVNIQKKLPDSLVITIKERSRFAVFCNEANCFFIDENGIAFEESQQVGVRLLPIVRQTVGDGVVILGKEAIRKELMEKIVKIKKDFEEKLNLQVKEINIPDSTRLNATTSEGWQVYFSLDGDIDLQITKLNYLLEKEIPKESRAGLQYIDLRFKDRAYYK